MWPQSCNAAKSPTPRVSIAKVVLAKFLQLSISWVEQLTVDIKPWNRGDSNMTNSAPARILVNSFADLALDAQLVSGGTDNAFVDVALADVVNLSAVGNTVAGTFDATANADISVAITNGRLSATDSTFLTVDATASADGETIHLHVTDRLQFDLSGTGYTGVGITLSAQTGGSLVVQPASIASADDGSCEDNKWSVEDDKGEFDLARFAGSVLGELHV
jgi:hypothetical protein